ncbi:glycosyltransferase family 2 protein [bacterium]|nr:glycosyltransferase family 2 protein [bacterium]
MSEHPLVSIIIPHHRGKEILESCLRSIEETDYPSKEVLVIDNNSRDGSIEHALQLFPNTQVVRSKQNLGYAGGCNRGLLEARGEYVLFLNDDAVLHANMLAITIAACESDTRIAACQPKILSLNDKKRFDYAGAAGGLMDRFGYPFAKGRIFFSIESDEHQYDESDTIFWASGAGMLVRKSGLDRVGSFDQDYFAHMEEIDLCWRFHLAGYRVVSVPQAILYHSSATTLKSGSHRKIFLNHRNSLLMLLKNYQMVNLLWIFPIRLLFELLALAYSLLKLDVARFTAVFRALIAAVIQSPKSLMKRGNIKAVRCTSDREVFARMYNGSIVFDYFMRRIRRVQDL